MKKIDIPQDINQEKLCDTLKDLNYKSKTVENNRYYENILDDVNKTYLEECETIKKDGFYKEHMNSMYKKFSNAKSYPDSYEYYIKIRSREKKCPFCNFPTREVTQIDHFLPKSKFPGFALVINNLVPICRECNTDKGSQFSNQNGSRFVHPYYDNKIDDIFELLKCEVEEKKEIAFRFYIDKSECKDMQFYNNVVMHIKELKLEELYTTDFIESFRDSLVEIEEFYEEDYEGDENERILEIKEIFKRKKKSYFKRKTRPWMYAGYSALLESEWFFSEYLYDVFNGELCLI